MRRFIVMTMFLASCASAAAGDYKEVRDLTVDAEGVETLIINVGAGSLDVRGIEGLDSIDVKATIVIPDADDDKGRKVITKKLTLTLESDGGVVDLKSSFNQGFWSAGSGGRVDLEVRAPSNLAVSIDDGSGSIDIQQVASVNIDDGSGSIDISGTTGDVYINDGSGSITVESVGGTVTIDDGSGSIRVNDVAEDLIILDDGSGSVSFSDVRGTVEQDG